MMRCAKVIPLIALGIIFIISAARPAQAEIKFFKRFARINMKNVQPSLKVETQRGGTGQGFNFKVSLEGIPREYIKSWKVELPDGFKEPLHTFDSSTASMSGKTFAPFSGKVSVTLKNGEVINKELKVQPAHTLTRIQNQVYTFPENSPQWSTVSMPRKGNWKFTPTQKMARLSALYIRLTKANEKRNKLVGRVHDYKGLIYGSSSDYLVGGDTLREMTAVLKSHESVEAFQAANPGASQARKMEGFRLILQGYNEVLRTLPLEYSKGLVVDKVFGNKMIKDGTLGKELHAVVKRVKAGEQAKVDHIKQQIVDTQQELMAHLDQPYLDRTQRKARAAELEQMSAKQLYDRVVEVRQLLGPFKQDVRGKVIAEGHASGESHASGGMDAHSMGFGMFGRVKSIGRASGSFSSNSKFKANFEQRQLIFEAYTYKTRVKNVAQGTTKRADLTPIEARRVAGLILEAHEIMGVLERKDPVGFSSLQNWIEHSQFTFNFPRKSQYSDRPNSTVNLSTAPQGIAGLLDHGIISAKLASRLGNSPRQSLMNID